MVRATTRFNQHKLTSQIDNYLYGRGLQVIPTIVSGEVLRFKGRDHRIDVRPFVEGRVYAGSDEDFMELLRILKPIHDALSEFPGSEEVKKHAAEFTEKMQRTKEAIVNHTKPITAEVRKWLDINNDFVHEHVLTLDPEINLKADAQVLHGDLHPGNIVFNKEGRAFLFDFEESYRMYLNRRYDLAYLAERFCLHGKNDLQQFCKRLGEIEKAYEIPLPPGEMLETIGKLSLRLILMTWMNFLEDDIPVDVNELIKFTAYHKQVRKISKNISR